MQTALLTFEVFNELGSFVAAAILIRLKDKGWKAHIERLSRPREAACHRNTWRPG
jgi:hypothetical protein